MSGNQQEWLELIGILGAAAGFVFIAVMLWRRHRSLTCRCDRERERERRAYWGFE